MTAERKPETYRIVRLRPGETVQVGSLRLSIKQIDGGRVELYAENEPLVVRPIDKLSTID
jgi:hypothetical protein